MQHDRLANSRAQQFFYIPNIAFTYLTDPNFVSDGLGLSADLFLDHSSRNRHTSYASGPVADLDFTASERIGRWQAGVAGFCARQWANDSINGVAALPNGKCLGALALDR
ncbi:MAG: hypothetical protein CPDRYMAC_7102 [uncultured Paraburkholderia sp.]|nr:MAG: hypothetical protein CPDRYDRY_7070 [uncultured Paraburkholderia sp.]CAH2946011.1 MAG: hypothetical protein CPDRYMAC_7102 [uncultured Paraburkholderia sp.]